MHVVFVDHVERILDDHVTEWIILGVISCYDFLSPILSLNIAVLLQYCPDFITNIIQQNFGFPSKIPSILTIAI